MKINFRSDVKLKASCLYFDTEQRAKNSMIKFCQKDRTILVLCQIMWDYIIVFLEKVDVLKNFKMPFLLVPISCDRNKIK